MSTRTGATRAWWLGSVALAAVALSACPKPIDNTVSRSTTMATQTISIAVSGTVMDTDGNPIAGATVTGAAGTYASTESDQSGHFSLGSFDVAPSWTITITVSKAGYAGVNWRLPVGTSMPLTIRMVQVFTLPIDDSTTGTLPASSLGDYVGEPYDSEYVYNARRFQYTTSTDADLIVELEWDRVGNAAPKMWAAGGTITSQLSGSKQVLTLPRATTGTLFVGQPYDAGALTQSVRFTLTTHRVQ